MDNTAHEARPGDILVADDDAEIRRMLVDILTDEGYQVRTAADGSEALAAITEREPALMFLDIVMPGISGVDVLENLLDSGRTFPVVVITATPLHANDINIHYPITLIHKPFNLTTILNCAEQRVQRSP